MPNNRVNITIGPLRPFDRPKLIGCFILLLVLATVAAGFIITYWNSIFKSLKYEKHASSEVKYDTTETAATANELLIRLRASIREFDEKSREIFGIRHSWLKDGKRADTPTDIYEFVQEKGGEKFLKEYFDLSLARVDLEKSLTRLEQEVDRTVSSLPKDATTERIFQAERIVRNDITTEINKLKQCNTILKELGDQFNE